MALGMCTVLVCEAICVALNNASTSMVAVVFVFAFEACITWGKLSSCGCLKLLHFLGTIRTNLL
jgi:hypothetical protein